MAAKVGEWDQSLSDPFGNVSGDFSRSGFWWWNLLGRVTFPLRGWTRGAEFAKFVPS
jgi:uncharacterized membrane protein YhaH (DUF805 family)